MAAKSLSQVMSKLVKDVAGDESLHGSPRQPAVVGELLQEAEGAHHVLRELQRLLPGRGEWSSSESITHHK